MDNEKIVMCASSYYTQKYYLDPKFDKMPKAVQDELKELVISLAERTQGIVQVGFVSDGSMFLESSGDVSDINYDEINAKLEIDRVQESKKELIRTLSMWYVLFFTDEGRKILESEGL